MQSIFGFLKNRISVGFENLFCDFFATISRQTMLHNSTWICLGDDIAIDLKRSKNPKSIGCFFFFPHADPRIGVKHIGTSSSCFGIIRNRHRRVPESFTKIGIKLKFFRRCDHELEAEPLRCPRPGASHIAVAVTEKHHLLSFPSPEPLLNGEQVRENLTRVLLVGQRIDRGQPTVIGELLDIFLIKSTDNDSMNHATEHASGVLDWFSTPNLNVVGVQKERSGAELIKPDFKTDAGSGRRLCENHRPCLAKQRLISIETASSLQLHCRADERLDVLLGEIFDSEKMFHNFALRLSAQSVERFRKNVECLTDFLISNIEPRKPAHDVVPGWRGQHACIHEFVDEKKSRCIAGFRKTGDASHRILTNHKT